MCALHEVSAGGHHSAGDLMPKFQKLVGLLNQKSNPSSPILSVDVHVGVMLTAQNFTYEQNHPD